MAEGVGPEPPEETRPTAEHRADEQARKQSRSAALLGGKAGEDYHRKVDRVGYPN